MSGNAIENSNAELEWGCVAVAGMTLEPHPISAPNVAQLPQFDEKDLIIKADPLLLDGLISRTIGGLL